jgi:hypothetical protein
VREDLRRLGIDTLEDLARQDADELYLRLARMDGRLHDPCLWDTFEAIIRMAGGAPRVMWWEVTPERKARQAAGDFPSGP